MIICTYWVCWIFFICTLLFLHIVSFSFFICTYCAFLNSYLYVTRRVAQRTDGFIPVRSGPPLLRFRPFSRPSCALLRPSTISVQSPQLSHYSELVDTNKMIKLHDIADTSLRSVVQVRKHHNLYWPVEVCKGGKRGIRCAKYRYCILINH